METWKNVVGYEGLYLVSNTGVVKSLGNGKCTNPNHCVEKELTIRTSINGYKRVKVYKDGVRKTVSVHRLVAQAFIPNKENKPQVNHKDGNKANNHVDNLEWATAKENILHSVSNGLQVNKKGSQHPQSKAVLQLDLQGNLVKEWGSVKEILREAGYNTIGIIKCCKKEKRYKTAYGYQWQYKHS